MMHRVHVVVLRQWIVATLRGVATILILSLSARAHAGYTLPPWSKGYLYIHHISTGRGNSAYIVMPDGTTLLIDAGETDPEFIKEVAPLVPFPPRPNADHDAGYWIADYIREFAPRDRPVVLD